MVVGPEELTNVSFKFKEADFSEFQQDGQLPFTVFTYEFSVKQNSEGLFERYAQEPSPVYIKMYANYSSDVFYKIGNDVKTISTETDNPLKSIASWCEDGNGGFYIFETNAEYCSDYYNKQLVTSPSYNILHYKKIEKELSFILKPEELSCSVKNIPVSMCTDGTNVYYVESVLDISAYGGDKLDLGSWGAWVHNNCMIKYFSIDNPSDIKDLDFSIIFKDGKVTSVYYYNNELYVAGYKKESIGSVTDNNEGKIDFFDFTYSVYKLSNPKDVSTAILVSDVFKNSTENARAISLLDDYDATNNRIKSYNAITDMAIMDGKLYVLENSYYYASVYSYRAKGSLRQISLESGNVLKIWDRTTTDTDGSKSFIIPNKILAVLPKKLELKIADSVEKSSEDCNIYKINLLDSSNISIEEDKDANASNYFFDKYSVGSDFFNSDAFNSNAYYTSKSSSEEFD